MTKVPGVTEEQFQQQVIDLAHTLHYRVAHFRSVRVQRKNGEVFYQTPVAADGAGWPDLVLVRPERVIFAELKSETGEPSPEQVAWLKAIDAGGGEAYCWRPSEWDDLVAVLLATTPPNRLEAIVQTWDMGKSKIEFTGDSKDKLRGTKHDILLT